MVMLSLGRTRLEESKGALRNWRDNLLQALLPLATSNTTSLGINLLLDKCVQLQAAILQRDQTVDMVANTRLAVERANTDIVAANKAVATKLSEISALAQQSAIASSAIDARLRECETSHETHVATITNVLGTFIPSMQGELRLQIPVYPLDGNDGAQIANLVSDIRQTIPKIFGDLAIYREIISHFPEDYARQTTTYEWTAWLSKLRPTAPVAEKSIPEFSKEVEEIIAHFSQEAQEGKLKTKATEAKELTEAIEIKQQELDELNVMKKSQEDHPPPPPPQYTFECTKADLNIACAVVLRDNVSSAYEDTTFFVEQVASLADILAPELAITQESRAILVALDSLASYQFGTNLPNLAQQSYIQHRLYSYLVPQFIDLQTRVNDYCNKYKAIKMKRASLEYFALNQDLIIQCARRRQGSVTTAAKHSNDTLGWEEAHELQVAREKADERVVQLEEVAKRHGKLLAQVAQEEVPLEEGIQKFTNDFNAIVGESWDEDRIMLGNIDEIFFAIETSFVKIAQELGTHPNTLADSVTVLPTEDALDIYARLASNNSLPGRLEWPWEPFQDPKIVIFKEKLDFIMRLLTSLTARNRFEVLSTEIVNTLVAQFMARLCAAVKITTSNFVSTHPTPPNLTTGIHSCINPLHVYLAQVRARRQHANTTLQLLNNSYLCESKLNSMKKLMIYMEWTLDRQQIPLVAPQVHILQPPQFNKNKPNKKQQQQPTQPQTPPQPVVALPAPTTPRPECKKILTQLSADLKLLDTLQTRTEALCTSLESRLPARLHWTLRAWRSATTAHAEKLTSTVTFIRSILLFEDARERSEISSAHLATVVKFHEATSLFRSASESISKDQAYVGFLNNRAEFTAKQAVELQASVGELEAAVKLTHSQFSAAQHELEAPLANVDTALSSDLAKIIPEIQDILQNIVKITDQVESVAHIHTLAEILQEAAVKLLESLTTLTAQLRQLYAWKPPHNPPSKDILVALLQTIPTNIRSFYSRLTSLSSALGIASANYHRREEQEEGEEEGEEGEEDGEDLEDQGSDEEADKDDQSQEDGRSESEERPDEEKSKQEDDGEYDEDGEIDSTESSVEGHPQAPPAPAPERKTTPLTHVRNIHGINILMRVKCKLDGRDPNASQKATIQDQVAWVIQEATNLDNLVSLYEGWTPWV